MTYVEGYVYGQHDVLTWLTVPGDDDAPLAAFDSAVQMRAALCCLAHNLAVAAALCRSHDLGCGFGYEWATGEPFWPRWEPGCGRDAGDAEARRRMPGAFAAIYGDRERWRVP